MTSTLTAATLTVKIHESISLNGKDQGGTTTLSLASINEISKRIVTVTTSEVEVIAMSTAASTGTYIEGDVRYMRFTNLDTANHVVLFFTNESNDEVAIKLDYGQSFIYNSNIDGGVVNTFDANAGAANINNLGDLVNITAQADTAAVDLEIFVASV